MTRPYILSDGAVADLQDITRYTLKNVGFILPDLRMAVSGSHYIFCMPQKIGPAIILAILHERMDILVRLRNRLNAET